MENKEFIQKHLGTLEQHRIYEIYELQARIYKMESGEFRYGDVWEHDKELKRLKNRLLKVKRELIRIKKDVIMNMGVISSFKA